MTSPDRSPAPAPDENPPPLAPKPTTLLSGVLVAGVLTFNIWMDARPGNSYDGAYVTYGLVLGVCGILGFDLSRFWPGGKDR